LVITNNDKQLFLLLLSTNNMTDSTQLRLLFESLRQELHTILEAQRVADDEDKLKVLNKEEKAISGLIKALLTYINLQSLKDK
jgi:hypothetical protein